MYEETISCYDIASKVCEIVTNNAANMVKAFTLLPDVCDDNSYDEDDDSDEFTPVNVTDEYDFLLPQHSPCFTHKLQLTVCNGLNQAGPIKQVIAKASKLVAYCHHSTAAVIEIPTA